MSSHGPIPDSTDDPLVVARGPEIRVKVSWCKGCGLCVEYCSRGVLAMHGSLPAIVHSERCTRCLQCEAICPDFAIGVGGGSESPGKRARGASSTGYEQHLRLDRFPLAGRSGSGDGVVAKAILRALARSSLSRDRVRLVADLGTHRVPAFLDLETVDAARGEALAVAVEVVTARPDLSVLVVTGAAEMALTGDLQLVRVARLGLDVAVVVLDERGVPDPSRPSDRNSDVAAMAVRAGACFVARETVARPLALDKYIERAIRKTGLALVAAVVPAPASAGRGGEAEDPVRRIADLRDRSVSRSRFETLSDDERRRAIVTGVLVDAARR